MLRTRWYCALRSNVALAAIPSPKNLNGGTAWQNVDIVVLYVLPARRLDAAAPLYNKYEDCLKFVACTNVYKVINAGAQVANFESPLHRMMPR